MRNFLTHWFFINCSYIRNFFLNQILKSLKKFRFLHIFCLLISFYYKKCNFTLCVVEIYSKYEFKKELHI